MCAQAFADHLAFPETTVLAITGNTLPWWWNNQSSATSAGFADPTGATAGDFFVRILDWYIKGGFTDELGLYHHSGHNYSFGYLEVLNEIDLNLQLYPDTPGTQWAKCRDNVTEALCAHGLLANIRRYIKIYDGIATRVREHHPSIKFVGCVLQQSARVFEADRALLSPAVSVHTLHNAVRMDVTVCVCGCVRACL